MDKQQLEKEFIAVVQQYEQLIYKVSSFYIDEDQSIHDMYQEIVMNLWKSFPSFRQESHISTWIYRVALNTCISYFRQKKNKPVYVDIPWDIPAEQSNDESIKELYALIGQLNKLERALILLYLDEKSYQEMSEITGLTVTNVATKLSRIKEKLKQMSNN